MPINRAPGRNVHFYDATSPEVALGGLIQNGSVTEANFLDMLGILLITKTPLRVQERASGHIVARTSKRLELGEYDVYCDSVIQVNDEQWVHRAFTRSNSGQEGAFHDGIQARDGRCVLSGVVNLRAPFGIWSGFEAIHIFPMERESLRNEHNYGRWISDVTPGVAKIDSCQNGFLLYGGIHTDFENYLVSVNPDDDYKVIVFALDLFGIDGRCLDFVCRDPRNVHSVSLLRWHFRQSVLANMRRAGEPIFEHDFPSGTDMVNEISGGPYAKERFELIGESKCRPHL